MSLRPYRFEAEAEIELQGAALRYDRLNPGLGSDFLAAVSEAIDAVRDWPGMGAPVPEGDEEEALAREEEERLRQMPVKRFPYHVGYLATDEEIRVLAIAHERRQPGYWTSRR